MMWYETSSIIHFSQICSLLRLSNSHPGRFAGRFVTSKMSGVDCTRADGRHLLQLPVSLAQKKTEWGVSIGIKQATHSQEHKQDEMLGSFHKHTLLPRPQQATQSKPSCDKPDMLFARACVCVCVFMQARPLLCVTEGVRRRRWIKL